MFRFRYMFGYWYFCLNHLQLKRYLMWRVDLYVERNSLSVPLSLSIMHLETLCRHSRVASRQRYKRLNLATMDGPERGRECFSRDDTLSLIGTFAMKAPALLSAPLSAWGFLSFFFFLRDSSGLYPARSVDVQLIRAAYYVRDRL